eukprot:TRINITY_DN3123_c0_g1_i1.p1 TRINITY_DN3123_c0_g1~~TRINITY_DN3123_c0_g1_i1.p1  ORF type:complete len:480 (-),score=85.47 TRINITY_DN3123_c0_g1_i1:18-1457(-)
MIFFYLVRCKASIYRFCYGLFCDMVYMSIRVEKEYSYWVNAKNKLFWHCVEKSPLFWYNRFKGNTPPILSIIEERIEIFGELEEILQKWIGLLGYIYGSEDDNFDESVDTLILYIHNFFEEYKTFLNKNDFDLKQQEEIERVEVDIPIYKKFQEIALNVEGFYIKTPLLIENLGRESWFKRRWLRIIGTGIGLYGLNRLSKKLPTVDVVVSTSKEVASGFYSRYIEGTVKNIINTIRSDVDEETIKLHQKSLQASEESLARMVIDFTSEQSQLEKIQIDEIFDKAKLGDLSPVMPYYEKEIQSPIKNAMFGQFIRLVLIQVQKAKVDVERSLLKVDKLMQANELNFQMIAAIPTLLFCLGTYRFITRSKNYSNIHDKIRTKLRELSIILNKLNNTELGIPEFDSTFFNAIQTDRLIPCKQHGQIILLIQECINLSRYLPEYQQEPLIEDLQEIISIPHLHQKLETANRITQTYTFLQLQ